MPPPTPSATFMSLVLWQFLGDHAQRVGVLHQAAAHFLHGCYGRLLGCSGKKRTCAILQLPRALGGDDDVAIGALLFIVGNRVHRVISHSFSHASLPQSFCTKLSRIGLTSSSIRALRSRSASTINMRRADASSIS